MRTLRRRPRGRSSSIAGASAGFTGRLRCVIVCGALAVIVVAGTARGGEGPVIRVGTLAFGTVNWELDVIRRHRLDTTHGFRLESVPLGSKNAVAVALQGDAVDIIVTDWIWVSRQRASGKYFTFVPYSLAVGGVMVRPDAGIHALADLAGHRLGVAGGPVDKSWLLLRAYSKHLTGADIAAQVAPVFAAPPLLNQMLLNGRLVAAINFWHYNARLAAAGMQPLVSVREMLPALGVKRAIPMLGWVFDARWADRHLEAIRGFIEASYAAKRQLRDSDVEWQALQPLLGVKDPATRDALRNAYRAGIPGAFGAPERAAAARVFAILAREGGPALIGQSSAIAPGTFWNGYRLPAADE